MNVDEARALLDLWRTERERVKAERVAAETQEIGLGKMIEGVELMFPELAPSIWDLAPPTPDTTPRISTPDRPAAQSVMATDGVRMILADNPAQWFSAREMVSEFENRGFTGTRTAIRLALKRATEKGVADMDERDQVQVFRFRSGAGSTRDPGVRS